MASADRTRLKHEKHVVVIGGGFAGLSAATRLVEAGARVTLLEKRGQLGGRAYSVVDEATGDVVDNGQHLFMGCYRATRAFLERIGTADKLRLQERLDVAFIDAETGRSSRLASRLPGPLSLVAGVFGFSSLPWRDKLAMLKVVTAIRMPSRFQPPATDWETVDGWLDRLGQSHAARRAFFHPLALATLNDDPRTASAKMFEAVLREAFFVVPGVGPDSDTRIGLARVGLSDLYVDDARAWLQARGATVRLGAAVERVTVARGVARGVALRGGETIAADAVIAACPPAALVSLVDAEWRDGETWWAGLEKLTSSPIVSLHLWLDRLVTDDEIIGCVGSPLHWIFNRNRLVSVRDPARSHLSLVVSAARALVERPSDEIVQSLVAELGRVLPEAARARVVHARLIKERDATIAHTSGSEGLRPRCQSPVEGLFAAGDFVRTGLPATIESAVRAADDAAELALAWEPPRAVAPAATGAFVPLSRLMRPEVTPE
jgi:squalene-associated FAD-dependent desaturase